MGAKQLDLTQTVLAELFPSAPSRAQKRQLQILEAAIKLFAKVGIESTTYDQIAIECEVSRPLIQHYFPDREELAFLALTYIRGNLQKIEVDAILAAPTPEAKVKEYVD